MDNDPLVRFVGLQVEVHGLAMVHRTSDVVEAIKDAVSTRLSIGYLDVEVRVTSSEQ